MDARAVIFDLDGTLLDTLADVAAAADHALRTLDQPTHPVQAYRHMVGSGADVLMRRALPDDQSHLTERALELFKDYYTRHMTDRTTRYPGVAELLRSLEERSIRKAVLSNKPDEATRRIVDELLGEWRWDGVAGHRPDVPKKPDPTAALALARSMGTPADRCALVGDSDVDVETARNAGMISIGAAWGFRGAEELQAAGAQVVIDRPEQLLQQISVDV